MATDSGSAVVDVDSLDKLRDTIRDANSGDTVRLLSSCIAQNTLTLTETIEINKDLTIDASACLDGDGLPRVTISGNDRVRVFSTSGNLTLVGLAIVGGKTEEKEVGGGVYCGEGVSLTMTGCTVSGCSAATGGGVYCGGGSTTLTGCTVSGCDANEGGGVYSYDGSVTLTNCTVAANLGEGIHLNDCISYNKYNTVEAWNYNPGGGYDFEDDVFVEHPVYNSEDRTWYPYDLHPNDNAINKGNKEFAKGIETDIEGNPRVMYAEVDLGAYEHCHTYIVSVPGDPNPDDLGADEYSLRKAVDAAKDYEIIAFGQGAFGETNIVELTRGEIPIDKTCRIDASNIEGGITISISEGNPSRIFNIDLSGGKTITLKNLGFTGGKARGTAGAPAAGGAILVSGGSSAKGALPGLLPVHRQHRGLRRRAGGRVGNRRHSGHALFTQRGIPQRRGGLRRGVRHGRHRGLRACSAILVRCKRCAHVRRGRFEPRNRADIRRNLCGQLLHLGEARRGDGGALANIGVGAPEDGTSGMTLVNVAVTGGNKANYGGGVFNAGSLSVVGGTFSGNAALGGGLYNGSLSDGEASIPGTVAFSRYFRKLDGQHSFCQFSDNTASGYGGNGGDMAVETASDFSGRNAASVGSMLVFTDGTYLCGGSAASTFYVFSNTADVESDRDTLEFSISNTGITAFDRSQGWQVWCGSEKIATADTFTDSATGLVLSGKLVNSDSRLWKGSTLKLVSQDGGTTYDFGMLGNPGNSENNSQLATTLGQTVPGFSEDVPEPCSSPADITGDGAVGALDFVLLSGAWMSRGGDGSWDARCDLNGNGIVDAADFSLFSRDWGWGADAIG